MRGSDWAGSGGHEIGERRLGRVGDLLGDIGEDLTKLVGGGD